FGARSRSPRREIELAQHGREPYAAAAFSDAGFQIMTVGVGKSMGAKRADAKVRVPRRVERAVEEPRGAHPGGSANFYKMLESCEKFRLLYTCYYIRIFLAIVSFIEQGIWAQRVLCRILEVVTHQIFGILGRDGDPARHA